MIRFLITAVLAWLLQTTPPAQPLALIDQLAKLRVDPKQIFSIRDITLRRDVLSMSFNRGTIAFLEPVNGRVTGAVFVGSGEIVAIPPNNAETSQLARYTRSGVLDEQFDTALLRFTDDTYPEILKAQLDRAQEEVPPEERASITALTEELVRRSRLLNYRILADFLGQDPRPFFHAQLKSEKLFWWNAIYDTRLVEEVVIHGGDDVSGRMVWSSFNRRSETRDPESIHEDKSIIDIVSHDIDATIGPDMGMTAKSSLRIRARTEGERVLNFVIAPMLRVNSVTEGSGREVPFHQGSNLTDPEIRSLGLNRFVVMFPEPLKADQVVTLDISYAGDAIETTGAGGVSRRFWYPSPETPDWARFSLSFHYPPAFRLSATLNQAGERETAGQRHSTWTGDREVLSAAFNVGVCTIQSLESMQSAVPSVHTCSSTEVNGPRELRVYLSRTAAAGTAKWDPLSVGETMVKEVKTVVEFLQSRFGDFPFPRLTVSLHPLVTPQSGPGLSYVSVLPFLNKAQRDSYGLTGTADFLQVDRFFARELARQWFEQSIAPRSYRDQWISDGLSGYAAAVYIENKHSETGFSDLLNRARVQLLEQSPEGMPHETLGPVSMGFRLTQPRTTEAYIGAVENKSVWVMHMLRMLMRRGEDDRFFAMTREFVNQFKGKFFTTMDFKRLAEKHAGEPLDWFFETWVFETGVPAYAMEFTVDPEADGFVVNGKLSQTGVPAKLRMPVPIYADDQLLGRVTMMDGEGSFRFTTKQKPQQVLVDPKRTILTSAP